MGKLSHLLNPSDIVSEEPQHVLERSRVGVGGFRALRFGRQVTQHRDVGSASRFCNSTMMRNISQTSFHALEVIAPVAQHVGDADVRQPCAREARADIRRATPASWRSPRHAAAWGEEQERVNLRHRAIDAPAGAHLAPVEDEAALDGRGVLSDISVYTDITANYARGRGPRTRSGR